MAAAWFCFFPDGISFPDSVRVERNERAAAVFFSMYGGWDIRIGIPDSVDWCWLLL